MQVEARVVNDGARLRIRSVGTDPTPWFPGRDGHRRRLLRKNDEATLEDGDCFGLLTTEPEPGSVRWVRGDPVGETVGPRRRRRRGRGDGGRRGERNDGAPVPPRRRRRNAAGVKRVRDDDHRSEPEPTPVVLVFCRPAGIR